MDVIKIFHMKITRTNPMDPPPPPALLPYKLEFLIPLVIVLFGLLGGQDILQP